MCSGSWPFSTFWTRSGTTWLIASFTLPDEHLDLAEGAHLADADAVERPHDRVRQPYWSHAARAKYSTASFWKPYDDSGGGTSRSSPSTHGHAVVDSNTIDELMYVTFWSRPARWAAIAASHDAAMIRSFVRQQVVGVGVEVADAADQRGAGDEVVAVGEQLGHQLDVAGVALDQAVRGVVVVALGDLAVLRVVVDADDVVAPCRAAPGRRSRR